MKSVENGEKRSMKQERVGLGIRQISIIALPSLFLFFFACAYHSEYPNEDPAASEAKPAIVSDTSESVEDPKASDDSPKEPAPLALSVNEAILMALENNVGFRIDRLEPAITATEEDIQRAAFDPTMCFPGQWRYRCRQGQRVGVCGRR